MLPVFSTPGAIAIGEQSRFFYAEKGLCWNPAGANLHLHVPNLRFNVDDVRVLYTATTALESVLSYLAGDLSFTVGEVTLSQQQLGMPAPLHRSRFLSLG